MEFESERERVCQAMNTTSFSSQVHHLLKAKFSKNQRKKNRVGKRMVTEETKQEKPGCHGRDSHHGPWWTPRLGRGAHWSRVSHFPTPLCFGASFQFAGFAIDHPSWPYWACFASSLDLSWPILHAFLVILDSISVHL